MQQRCAVVVGGTSGLGKAIALGLAKTGMDVVAMSRSEGGVAEMAAEIVALGRRTLALTADVQDRGSLLLLRQKVVAEFGRVDVLVNAADVTKREATLDVTEETWDRILDVNLTGTLRGCQVFGEHMAEELVSTAVYLSSPETTYTTGQAIVVDGGMLSSGVNQ